MDARARRALGAIPDCPGAERYLALTHFVKRLDRDGFFRPNVLAVIDDPSEVRFDGRDQFDRAKWVVAGKILGGFGVELVCAIGRDDDGNVTVFITIY